MKSNTESNKGSLISRMNCCGLTVEMGCFIYSIINIVVVSICFAASIYYVKWVQNCSYFLCEMNYIIAIPLVVSMVVSGAFAVLLCYGSYKKRPKIVLAYFVFAVIERVYAASIVLFFMQEYYSDKEVMIPLCVGFLINGIYGLLLIVVYRAWMVLSSGAIPLYRHVDNLPLA